jgi:hypothetical protein
MVGSEDPNGGYGQRQPSPTTDTLGYLCDIIHELKHLADRSGQRTFLPSSPRHLPKRAFRTITRGAEVSWAWRERDHAAAVPFDAAGERQLHQGDLHAGC